MGRSFWVFLSITQKILKIEQSALKYWGTGNGDKMSDNTWLRLTVRLPYSLKPFLGKESNKSEAIIRALESHFGVIAPADKMSEIETRIAALEDYLGLLNTPTVSVKDEGDKPVKGKKRVTDAPPDPVMEETLDPVMEDAPPPPVMGNEGGGKKVRVDWVGFVLDHPGRSLDDLSRMAVKRWGKPYPITKECVRRALKTVGQSV